MLPTVAQKTLAAASTFKRGALASLLAIAIAVPAAPAMAWGQREQDTLKGVVGTLIIGSLIMDAQKNKAKPQPQPQPVYQAPGQEPRYYQEPGRGYGYGHRRHHEEPRYQAPQVSIYHTPAAAAFNSYSSAERRLIQRRLAAYGYYRGGVDGAFGPGTYSAVVAYANAQRLSRQLGTVASSYGVYDSLIY